MSSFGYMTKAFNSASRSETGFGFGLGEQQQEQKPVAQKTILECLAPNKDFKSRANVGDVGAKANVDIQKPGAASLVKQNTIDLKNTQQGVQQAMTDVSDTIRQKKSEVAAVAKDAGFDPGKVFPNEQLAGGGEGGLLMAAVSGSVAGAAVAAVAGKGSMATAAKKVVGNSDMAITAMSDRGKSPKEIMGMIEDQLRAASGGPEQSQGSFGMLTSAGSSEEGAQKSTSDWNAFFDNGHPLAEFMKTDPDNPPEALFPEFAVLAQANAAIDNGLQDLDRKSQDITDNFLDNDGQDTFSLNLNAALEKEDWVMLDAFDCQVTGDHLQSLSGVSPKEGIEKPFTAAVGDVKEVLPELKIELPPELKNTFTNDMTARV